MRYLFVLTAVLIAGLAPAVGACGSDDEDSSAETAYVNEVNAIQEDALATATAATADVPKGGAELADQLGEAAGAVDQAVTDLGAVDVPDEITEEHDDLVSALEDLRDLLDGTVETLEQSESGSEAETADTLAGLSEQLVAVNTRIGEAISRINTTLGPGPSEAGGP